MKKLFTSICLFTALMFTGCDNGNDAESGDNYVYSDRVTVGTISESLAGDVAVIVPEEQTYVIIITDYTQLQRRNAEGTGYMNIPLDQFSIITPGTAIQFGWVEGQIDYSPIPPVVKPQSIIIEK